MYVSWQSMLEQSVTIQQSICTCDLVHNVASTVAEKKSYLKACSVKLRLKTV